jgi:hypothetical protein
MGYSLNEALKDSEEYSAFIKALKEVHPDAVYNNGRWFASSLKAADCDGFSLETETRENGTPLTYACLYRTVGTGRVYRETWMGRVLLNVFLSNLKDKNPEFYGQLLAKLREG